jgi:cell division protein FtsI (penicillin-binding protein 3)
MAISLAALAQAYTIFCNDGARVPLTLRLLEPRAQPERVPVVRADAARAVLEAMRAGLADSTGRRGMVDGLDIAGKTGTADLQAADGGYDQTRSLASFAAVFPAEAPRYVMIVALEAPQRGLEPGLAPTGGGVAAPLAARTLVRIAPFLGLSLQRPQDRDATAQNAPARGDDAR